MIVKVCGLRSAENVKSLIPLQVDWAGFIFYEDSPRNVENDLEQISFLEIRGGYTRGVKRVGVFVNASKAFILEKAKRYLLDIAQLHGEESAMFCDEIKATGLSVVKAFSIDKDFAFRSIVAYEFACDYLLFDTKGAKRGGNGDAFDWSILEKYEGQTPFILSGGIGPDSVQDLLAFSHPMMAGIDVNSQFEIEPGLKDVGKIKNFLEKLGSRFFRAERHWVKK